MLIACLDNGLGLYRYRYLWSDTVYVGVMARRSRCCGLMLSFATRSTIICASTTAGSA
ncbi:MAG: hypothetical protein WBF24_12145 [Xanthobacteraceae bacterium]